MKTIMIIGGGYYQLPLIKKSVELGYNTIVCGIAGNYPGYKFASKWVDVDTFDKDAILKVAREEKINGIVLCGSDACMPTIGYVCDQMNLLGPTEQATINASNKALMKECFNKYGVRTAQYKKIYTIEQAEAFAQEYNFSVVLKVVDASGSKGIAIVKTLEELRAQYPIVTKETKKDYIIIEEFISGEEFGAQAFVRNGKLTFVMPHGDIVFHGSTDVPIGHYAPYEKESDIINDVTEQLQKCIDALEINNTAINADFILSNGKVFVLEIGARAGATCLPELVSNHYGINYYEYLINQCVGNPIDIFPRNITASVVETIISSKSGIVENVTISELPKEIVNIEVYPKVGEKITAFRNAYDRIGVIISKGKSVKELIEINNIVKNEKIKIYLK